MSRTLNKVMLIGNVGKAPELKKTPGGIPVTSFRIATSETWRDREGNVKEQTDWHTIVAWRGLAEVVTKLINKGSRIYVEGKLQARNIEDKDGVKKCVVEIMADNLLLLDKKIRDGGLDNNDDYSEFSGFEDDNNEDFNSTFKDFNPSSNMPF